MILEEFNLSSDQLIQFENYYKFLNEENKKINLTSITEKNEVYIKHFYDSLKICEIIDFKSIDNICDIGSGAGFPGIPLKILFPHLKLTIIEPTLKRIRFLEKLTEILKLDNVELINERAEDEIVNKREYFDVVTARAVASLPVLLELALPFVKVKGYFLALKGSSYQEELDISKNAFKKLNSQVNDIIIYELPNNLGQRSIIKVIKNKGIDHKYPRKYSIIKKNHL